MQFYSVTLGEGEPVGLTMLALLVAIKREERLFSKNTGLS